MYHTQWVLHRKHTQPCSRKGKSHEIKLYPVNNMKINYLNEKYQGWFLV